MNRFSNINNILAFVTVAQEGSVSKAADILKLTQPAISHQIKRLSEETGITLFRRTSNGLVITPDGDAILEKARVVLTACNDFRQFAHIQSGQVTGNLKIGTIIDPEFIQLGLLLNQLGLGYPNISTEMVHGISGETLDRVKRGQVDAGFYISGADHEDFDRGCYPIFSMKLAEYTYRVIAPVGWDDRIKGADWPKLAALPWVGTPEISVHNRILSAIFAKHGCRQNAVALVDQEPTMLEMVRSGIGLSLCREAIALEQQKSFGLAVCDDISLSAHLSITALEKQKNNPVILALFKTLRSIWKLPEGISGA